MVTDEVRIGVAGLGRRGVGWLRRLERLPGYRVTAICDPIAALHRRALSALDRAEGVAVYARYEDLLADPNVDAVALTVRSRDQGGLAAQALEAGKHVNAEVPAAHTIEDCWRIVVAAERSGRVYQLAEQTRYWGFVDAWRQLVAGGQLGHVTLCEGQYFHYIPGNLFQDPTTGRLFTPPEASSHPEARPTWLAAMPPIHYLPHELSPMLHVLDDRVVEVTAMSTRAPSYAHPEVPHPDMQVALMKTEKDAILRMAVSFAQPHRHENYHWYQVLGTRGRVEWKRSAREQPKMWLADAQMHDLADVDWRYERLTKLDDAGQIKPLGFDSWDAMCLEGFLELWCEGAHGAKWYDAGKLKLSLNGADMLQAVEAFAAFRIRTGGDRIAEYRKTYGTWFGKTAGITTGTQATQIDG